MKRNDDSPMKTVKTRVVFFQPTAKKITIRNGKISDNSLRKAINMGRKIASSHTGVGNLGQFEVPFSNQTIIKIILPTLLSQYIILSTLV